MALAALVGALSAFPAVLLGWSVHQATHWLMQFQGRWWLVGVSGGGAALSALYLRHWLRDDAGHGVPALIVAASRGGGRLRSDLIYSRLLSSFLTVSSGGSAGLEGPIATSGGALGSWIGRILRFDERRRVLLLGYGVAGAVAAIFNAPLTGIVFTLEVILGEWSTFALLPTMISAVSATQVSRLLLGNEIAFSHHVSTFGVGDLGACIVLGLALGGLAVFFQRSLRFSERSFGALQRVPYWARAGLGGVLVGVLGLAMPEVLHDGYLSIRRFLSDEPSQSTLLLIALFVVLKLVACCFTLGSGGSGGVFAPGLVLGSALGFGYGRFLQWLLPGLAPPSAFALVGMAGMVAGLMHAPLTGIFLVLEITGGYHLILPLMITAGLAMLVSYYLESGSVYTHELLKRGPLGRRGSDAHLLSTMHLRELLDDKSIELSEDTLLGEFVELFKQARRNVFPVVRKADRAWLGVVYLDDIRPYLFDRALYPLMTMGEVLDASLPTIDVRETPQQAIKKFEQSGAWSLPILENGRFLGMISKSTLFDRYRRELIVHSGD